MSMLATALVCFVQVGLRAGLVLQQYPDSVEGNFSGLHAELEVMKARTRQKRADARCNGLANKTMAIIISGQESRLLLSSKLKHVVAPLAESGVSVDVYLDVLANSLQDVEYSHRSQNRVQSDDLASMREVLPQLLEQYCASVQLMNIREERETIDIPPAAYPTQWLKKQNGGYSEQVVTNVFRRYSSYKFVLEKITSHEIQRGRSYDFVMVTRDDDEWRNALNFTELSSSIGNNSMLTKDCLHWGGLNDQTLLFGRQGAEKVLGGMLPYLMNPKIHRRSKTHGNAERTLNTFAHSSRVDVHQVLFSKMPTTVALYGSVDSQGNPALCLKKFYTCEKNGWHVPFCHK